MIRLKRGLAILLSTCLIGGMVPLPVSAEGTVFGNEIQMESTESIENSQGENSGQKDDSSGTVDSRESTTEQDGNTGEQEETVTGQDDTNAQPGTEEQPSETKAIAAIQELIDALPEADSITEETLEAVTVQLDAIDEAETALSDEELSQLDLTRYDTAIEKVMALMGMDGAGVAMMAANVATPKYLLMCDKEVVEV